MDEAKVAELIEGFRRGSISAEEFAKTMNAAMKDVKDSSGKFSTTFTTGAGQVVSGVTSFTKSMANGAQGASAFSGIITATTTGLSTMLGKFGVAGEAIGKMAAFGEGYVVQALKQSDDLFATFQGLSKIGGAGTEGMKGIFDNMQKLGMTMDQLPQFGALITKNSEALAVMGGTVSEGTKKFATVASSIQQSGLQTQFERMGITVQEQNERTADYLKLQTLTGMGAVKTQAQLNDGAAEYIRQQDRLSRLTGKSADSLAKEAEARQSNERYAAVTLELQMKAAAAKAAGDDEGFKAAQAQLDMNEELLKRTPASLKQGIQDLMSGVVNSPDAQKIFITAPKLAQDVMAQQYSSAEQLENMIISGQAEMKASAERDIGLAKAGLANKVGADYAGRIAFGKIASGEAAKLATKEQTTQAAGGGDVDVNNQVALRDAQRATTTAMDDLVKIGVGPLTSGMEKLATNLAGVVTVLPGVGKNVPLNREPTKEEAARGITKEQVARGRYAPATADLKSELPDIDMDKLSAAWKTFVSNAVFNLTTETDKKATEKKKVPENTPDNRPNFGQDAAEPAVRQAPSDNNRPAARQAPTEDNRPNFSQRPDRGAGPAYQTPVVLGDTRPENQTSTKSAAAGSATELATMFSDGFKALSRGQAEQTASVDELVELMRRSVGVQGKILQTSRA